MSEAAKKAVWIVVAVMLLVVIGVTIALLIPRF